LRDTHERRMQELLHKLRLWSRLIGKRSRKALGLFKSRAGGLVTL
jgi:hypothetical protein